MAVARLQTRSAMERWRCHMKGFVRYPLHHWFMQEPRCLVLLASPLERPDLGPCLVRVLLLRVRASLHLAVAAAASERPWAAALRVIQEAEVPAGMVKRFSGNPPGSARPSKLGGRAHK